MDSPDLSAIFRDLAASDVRWVLTGSLAAAAHGAPLRARDVDVTPALDVDNLHRIARFLQRTEARPHFTEKGGLTREQCDAWRPWPVSLANLDYLFRTRHGLVDVVPELAGTYRDLVRRAVPMEAFGVRVLVAAAEDVLGAVRAKERRKNAGRQTAYADLATRAAERRTTFGAGFRPAPADGPPIESAVVAAAERVLGERTGGTVRLRAREALVAGTGYRNRLVRCDVEAGADALPATLLLKCANVPTGEIFREWAGYELLARLPAATPLAPRFFGGDAERRFLLLEDLGDLRDRDLASRLVGRDGAAAAELLRDAAGAAGALQAATVGAAAEYDAIAGALPGAAAAPPHASDRLAEHLRALPDRFAAVGAPLPADACAEIEEAARVIESPGPFRAYSRGDVCTKNVVHADGGARLVDLEYGGFRHALIDGAFFGLRHLACLYAGRFPPELLREAEDIYRAALARGCLAAADDDAWARGFTAVSAGWLAAILEPLALALETDRRRGSATLRQRILAALTELESIAERRSRLPALADASARLRASLGARWDVAPLALHPAFR